MTHNIAILICIHVYNRITPGGIWVIGLQFSLNWQNLINSDGYLHIKLLS